MAIPRKRSSIEKRLREIERERARVRQQIDEVRRWADHMPSGMRRQMDGARLRTEAPDADWGAAEVMPAPMGMGPMAVETSMMTGQEVSLDFMPGPDGLQVQHVIMPQLQRTDLLRPSLGSDRAAPQLMVPEHDRFRNYFGTTGLKRVREARRNKNSYRARAIFMIVMVVVLSIILIRMLT